MTRAKHLEILHQKIDKMAASRPGAKAMSWTPLPTGPGNYLAPTIVVGADHAAAAAEELFGPVATWHTFETEQQALEMACEAHGILQAYVYTANEARGLEFGHSIHSGLVMVNGVGFGFETHEGAEPVFSFWGTSGMGEDGPLETLVRFFAGSQVCGINGKCGPPTLQSAARSPASAAAGVGDEATATASASAVAATAASVSTSPTTAGPATPGGSGAEARWRRRVQQVRRPPSNLDFRKRYYFKLDIGDAGKSHGAQVDDEEGK